MDPTLIAVMLAWFAAAFVCGVTGLGSALLAVPILSFFLPIRENILLSCLHLLTMDFLIFLQHRHFCMPRASLKMMLGIIPGTILGVIFLNTVPAWLLQASVGVVLLAFLSWQIFGNHTARGAESWGLATFAGGMSAALGTAISTDGPPAAAYGLYCGWAPRVYLGTLGLFYTVRGSMGIVAQAWCGLYTKQVLIYYLWSLIPCILGTMLALPVVKRCTPERYHKILCLFIGMGGVACLVRAVMP